MAAIVFTTLAMNFIALDGKCIPGAFNPWRCIRRCGHVTYAGLRSFATLDVVEAPDEPSTAEKIIIAGFVVFALVVVTAYTATAATALYVAYTYQPYGSLVDVTSYKGTTLCIEKRIEQGFTMAHPEATENKKVENVEGKELIKRVGHSCDVAVASKTSFDEAAADDSKICSKAELVGDDVLYTKVNSVAFSTYTLDVFPDLIDVTNDWISRGAYAKLDQTFATFPGELPRKRMIQGYSTRPENKRRQKNRASRSLKGSGGATTTATGAGSSVVSTSTYLSNACQSSSYESAGLYRLEPKHLAMPLVIASGCAVIGLIIFFNKKRKTRMKLKRLKNENNITKIGVLDRQDSKYARVSQLEDEELLIRSIIEDMTPAEMWEELKRMSLDESAIGGALDDLPDTASLFNLLLREKLSPVAKEFQMIRSLPVSDLCHILTSVNHASWKDMLNDEEDPQGKLAELVARDPMARYVGKVRGRFNLKRKGNVSALECATDTPETSGNTSTMDREISVTPLISQEE